MRLHGYRVGDAASGARGVAPARDASAELLQHNLNYVQKPFTPSMLAQKLRQVLYGR